MSEQSIKIKKSKSKNKLIYPQLLVFCIKYWKHILYKFLKVKLQSWLIFKTIWLTWKQTVFAIESHVHKYTFVWVVKNSRDEILYFFMWKL